MKIDRIGDYIIDLQVGLIKNPGYRIYKLSWYNRATPVKNHQGRQKLVSTWSTEAEARAEIARLIAQSNP